MNNEEGEEMLHPPDLEAAVSDELTRRILVVKQKERGGLWGMAGKIIAISCACRITSCLIHQTLATKIFKIKDHPCPQVQVCMSNVYCRLSPRIPGTGSQRTWYCIGVFRH